MEFLDQGLVSTMRGRCDRAVALERTLKMNTANQTLAGRLRFELTPQKWSEFQAALSRPVAAKPKLKQLLNEKGLLG